MEAMLSAKTAAAKALAKAGQHAAAAATWAEVAAAWKELASARLATGLTPVAPIEHFFRASDKSGNDAANDARERYLEGLLDATDLTDPRELHLQAAWRGVIHGLCPVEFATVKIHRKGGRGANYDFLCTYLAVDGSVVHRQPVEFKYGATAITGIPQFLSLAEKDLPFPVSYAAYYYDHYLPAYVGLDAEGLGSVARPDRAFYLQKVYNDAYDAHPFFRAAYDREEVAKAAKAAVVNESIRAFLAEYGSACDLAHLSSLLQAKQVGKVFVLWDGVGAFHLDRLSVEELTVTEVVGVRNGNTLEVRSAGGCTFHLLLRWKNHKGILYPAWQIKLAAVTR